MIVKTPGVMILKSHSNGPGGAGVESDLNRIKPILNESQIPNSAASNVGQVRYVL